MARQLGSRIEGLTPRQSFCLESIMECLKDKARTPSVSELSNRLMVTRGSIDNLLLALEQKGYIRRASVTSGHLTLLKDTEGDEVEVIVTIRKKKQQ